ncbi:hypothetical protein ABZV34_27195 [Streptomyces sp. NPDC005195]|uniref:hypothetical protein n=1 Tax=Streptomyces sp. NPDC005195 TaxID=3154561 RepID=UPI0033B3307B
MTNTLNPTATTTQHRRGPFPNDPGRWKAEHARALLSGHDRDGTCSDDCEPVLVYERARWGWLAWTMPGDGTFPDRPHHVGILTPDATRMQCLALRWLTRRPLQRIALAPHIPGSLRAWAAVTALAGLAAGLLAMSYGVAWDVVLPAVLLAPSLAEHLPGQLDARARRHVRTVDGEAAVRYLQRLTTMQTDLDQATAASDRYEVRRSAEIGQQLLWDAAGLLQNQDTRAAFAGLIARERLMVQLADQVASILTRTSHPAATGQDREPGRQPGPYPPELRPSTQQSPHRTPSTSPRKGSLFMTQPALGVRTVDVYLLFAHEAYYPHSGSQEINTTVIAADTLLHPQVQQPDGARIHDILTRGREPGTVVPLATLTHELAGGANWPEVGDFVRVTTDLVTLVQMQLCDALSLGLPELARALICIGPGVHQEVRTFDASAGDFTAYGQDARAAVLAEVSRLLAVITPERPFWPGDGLLPPLGGSV